MSDPFAVLGLAADASADDVRAARRRLAKTHHPDAGGDAGQMRLLNQAAASALRLIDGTPPGSQANASAAGRPQPEQPQPDQSDGPSDAQWYGTVRDIPSFTVEALPVETFEALLLATGSIGEIIDDDPPYRLDVVLSDPMACFCRLELVPDAGASTVSITIATADGRPRPSVEQVRDLWIAELNRLDW